MKSLSNCFYLFFSVFHNFEKFANDNYYDFENPDNIIDNILLNVRSRFAPLKQEVIVKCGFKL